MGGAAGASVGFIGIDFNSGGSAEVSRYMLTLPARNSQLACGVGRELRLPAFQTRLIGTTSPGATSFPGAAKLRRLRGVVTGLSVVRTSSGAPEGQPHPPLSAPPKGLGRFDFYGRLQLARRREDDLRGGRFGRDAFSP